MMPALRQLIVRGAQLNDHDAAHLAAGLAINSRVSVLDVSANTLSLILIVALALTLTTWHT